MRVTGYSTLKSRPLLISVIDCLLFANKTAMSHSAQMSSSNDEHGRSDEDGRTKDATPSNSGQWPASRHENSNVPLGRSAHMSLSNDGHARPTRTGACKLPPRALLVRGLPHAIQTAMSQMAQVSSASDEDERTIKSGGCKWRSAGLVLASLASSGVKYFAG